MKPKILFFNIAMITLLLLIALSWKDILDPMIMFIYLANLFMVLHIWLGGYFMVRYLETGKFLIDWALGGILLAFLFYAALSFADMVRWASLFSFLYLLVIIRYFASRRYAKEKRARSYSHEKIKNEFAAVPLFLIFAAASYLYRNNDFMIRLIQVIMLLLQIFFAIWLIFVRRVYSILRSSS